MDGLARAAAALYREIRVGGKTYKIAQPRLGDLAALEAALLARLPDPVEQAARVRIWYPLRNRRGCGNRPSRRRNSGDSPSTT